MNSRLPLIPLILLGIVATIGLFAAAALLPPFAVAVLLMVFVLAAFAVLAFRERGTG